jgi:dTDP-glucose 4,6-dehydratase
MPGTQQAAHFTLKKRISHAFKQAFSIWILLTNRRRKNFMADKKNILVTGGAGFIGTNFIHHALSIKPGWKILNLDALTYAGNLENFKDLSAEDKERYRFFHGDIRDELFLDNLFNSEEIDGIVHFAAESHVDRSILGPKAFLETNVVGTFHLLEAGKRYWEKHGKPDSFRFLHISTDEVYGSLGPTGHFTEETSYDPSSPYSASKASSDHFVKAYFRTYNLPTLITNCSNNYGPFQFPEKLIPLMILNIIEQKSLPVYGDGRNVRDWLYVIDHCDAIIKVFEQGAPGETYNIGGGAERENITIVHLLCDILDDKLNHTGRNSSRSLIRFVADRPGHDLRYAIDASKIHECLGWKPLHTFEKAMISTVDWYLSHMDWVNSVRSGEYRKWLQSNYQDRG